MPRSNGAERKRSGKYRYITLSDNIPEHWPLLIDIAKCYDFYAYIFHKPDNEDGKEHLHILCMSHSPLIIDNHFKRWESVISKNFLQSVISPKRFARYLLHLDSHEKILYDIKDIHTNSLDHFMSLINQSFKPDTVDMWKDYCALRTHRMTPNEFLEKYRADISELGIYQRFSIYSKIFDAHCYDLERDDGAIQDAHEPVS